MQVCSGDEEGRGGGGWGGGGGGGGGGLQLLHSGAGVVCVCVWGGGGGEQTLQMLHYVSLGNVPAQHDLGDVFTFPFHPAPNKQSYKKKKYIKK